MLKEFRNFVLRGNVLDLAVAFIMGVAFSAVVTSLVKDVIMPPIGFILGNVDFSNLFWALNGQTYATLADAQKAGAPTLNYGLLINTIINFLIVALAMFLIVRAGNTLQKRLMKPAPAAAPATKECPYCFTSIPVKATRCPNCTSELKTT